jgi:hypothetical protein
MKAPVKRKTKAKPAPVAVFDVQHPETVAVLRLVQDRYETLEKRTCQLEDTLKTGFTRVQNRYNALIDRFVRLEDALKNHRADFERAQNGALARNSNTTDRLDRLERAAKPKDVTFGGAERSIAGLATAAGSGGGTTSFSGMNRDSASSSMGMVCGTIEFAATAPKAEPFEPKVGQTITWGDGTHSYKVLGVSAEKLWVDLERGDAVWKRNKLPGLRPAPGVKAKPKVKKIGWINVYRTGTAASWPTRAEADKAAKNAVNYRLDCVPFEWEV